MDDSERSLVYDGEKWINANDDDLCWLVVKEMRANPVFKGEVATAYKLAKLQQDCDRRTYSELADK